MLARLLQNVAAALPAAAALALPATAAVAPLMYPPAQRGAVTDRYFGTTVADPYRWMEDVDAPATVAWVAAEGALTRSYLDAIPQRPAIAAAYRRILNYEKLTAPFREGSRYFFFRNSGLQNQNVLYVRDGETGEPRVFLDPNTLAADGTVALAGAAFTRDGSLMAYATQSSGVDWQTWRVKDVATGRDREDVVRWSKFSNATWDGNGGFYYSGYDAPKDANADLSALGVQKLWYHRLGTAQAADRLVYASTAHPDEFVGSDATQDERYVFVMTSKGDGNSLSWKRRGQPDSAFAQMFALDTNVSYNVVGNDGDRLYVQTNAGAERGRLAYVDVTDPSRTLHDIVPQTQDKLDAVSLIGNRFYLAYLHDAHSIVKIVDLAGKPQGSIDLPGIGSGGLPVAKREDRIAYYDFMSYTYPPTIYRYDTHTGHSTIAVKPHVAFDPAPYTTEQIFATSKDGVKVPIFLTHRKGMPLDGTTPALMYGYGGFNISATPSYASSVALWLEMGGVYAHVVLRGGGEYGDAWHDAGRLANKQHVFDDYIAAAQELIDRKITSTPKLAISGGSNGGLLVGAVLTQRPDLFGAALPEVGVLDMLRFQTFTVGKAWVPEYGSSTASEDQFKTLFAYSPYHNARSGMKYPPTMISTADHDDRVFPAHSFKFAAALQHAQGGDAPILLRVESKSGHGGGRPTEKIIEEAADKFAFLVKSLGLTPALP